MKEHLIDLNEELIRSKAYELWQSRGGGFGDPNPDWYQAKEMLVEKQRSQLESLVEPVKEISQQTAKFYDTVTQVPKQVSELQKETTTSLINAISDQQDETLSNIKTFSEKAWKFQETLAMNSIELQAKLARMSLDIQKQVWQEYFKLLKKEF